jgi:energy-converting hydrogenase Eha subunit A
VIPAAGPFLALALSRRMLGNTAYCAATLGFVVGAVAEIIVILGWMGRIFERTEPS